MKVILDKPNNSNLHTSIPKTPAAETLLGLLSGNVFSSLMQPATEQVNIEDEQSSSVEDEDSTASSQSASQALDNLDILIAEIANGLSTKVSIDKSDNSQLTDKLNIPTSEMENAKNETGLLQTEELEILNGNRLDRIDNANKTAAQIPLSTIGEIAGDKSSDNPLNIMEKQQNISTDDNNYKQKLTTQNQKLTENQATRESAIASESNPVTQNAVKGMKQEDEIGLRMNSLGALTDDVTTNISEVNQISISMQKWTAKLNDREGQSGLRISKLDVGNTQQTSMNALMNLNGREPSAQVDINNQVKSNITFRINTIENMQQLNPGNQNMGLYHATIEISPAGLGPVTARINVIKGRATVDIMVKNSHVSEIVKSHLAELREQFAQSDMQIDNINVQYSNQKQQEYDHQASREFNEDAGDIKTNTSSNKLKISEKNRVNEDALIDTYI